MPGLIVDVGVEVGQDVKKGDKLLVLNAMKMENIIKAPADGKVRQVLVNNGQNVEKNQVLIQF
jgi:biotin carboxyl carrier protein